MSTNAAIDKIADPDFRQLGELVVESMQRLHVPGVAVGILHEGKEQTAGFGVTNVEHPLPVDADTLFQIGSITKTFTASAAMRLVEMGKLDLDAPVRTYVPDLRLSQEDVAAQVALRHLLTHTGGWVGDYFEDTGPGDDALAKYVAGMAGLPQLTPLGEVWSYCNSGFCLAGRVIEAVTGQTYEAAVEELLLKPLGLAHSFFYAADAITYRVAAGHLVPDETAVVARPWPIPRSNHAAGAIVSCMTDLLRYARFQLGDGTAQDGTRLLKAESMALMRSPHVPIDRDGNHIGLAWFLRNAGSVRTVGHGGGTHGQITLLTLVPERNFAIAVLTNSSRGGELCADATRWALRQYLGAAEPEPVHRKLPEAELAPFLGRYTSVLSDAELSLRDGELVLQVIPKGGFPKNDSPPAPTPPPTQLAFYGDDRVVGLDTPFKDVRADFLRNPDGSIAWFRFGGRIRARDKG